MSLFKLLILTTLIPFIAFASNSNLIQAIKSNNISAVALELSNGAEIDKKFEIAEVDEETTPLMLAAYYGNLDIVKLLVDKGADVFIRNSILDSALTIAQVEGHNEIVNFLIPFFREVKYDFFGASEDIEWAESIDDAIDKSREEGEDKFIMIVFIRIGCKWSQKMGENAFDDELVVRSINKSVIPVLVDKEIGDYSRNKFPVKYTPTIFFIDNDKDIRYKIFGFRDTSKFSHELREIEERNRKRKRD